MTLDLLRETKIGKALNDAIKTVDNATVVAKGKGLLAVWKGLVSKEQTVQKESTSTHAVQESKAEINPPVFSGPVIAAKSAPSMRKSIPNIPLVQPQKAQLDVLSMEPPKRAQDVIKASDDSPHYENFSDDFDPFLALASLAEEAPRILKKKRIQWPSDDELAHVLEFEIDGVPADISLMHEHALRASHSEGGARKFNESRRKERARGGQGLRSLVSLREQTDLDDEIEGRVNWFYPWKVALPEECSYYLKNVKSYEKQDLADIHAGRQEAFYPDNVPVTPSEPSSSSGFAAAISASSGMKTLDVALRGVVIEIEEEHIEREVKPDMGKFTEEFVKLESSLQRAITGNEQLLKYFRNNPEILKDLTTEKIAKLVSGGGLNGNPVKAPPPAVPASTDKVGWGVASIVSAIKSQVKTSLAHKQSAVRETGNLNSANFARLPSAGIQAAPGFPHIDFHGYPGFPPPPPPQYEHNFQMYHQQPQYPQNNPPHFHHEHQAHLEHNFPRGRGGRGGRGPY